MAGGAVWCRSGSRQRTASCETVSSKPCRGCFPDLWSARAIQYRLHVSRRCYVAKYMGDGVLIYFGYPQAHEDDAERGVRAALTGKFVKDVSMCPRLQSTAGLRLLKRAMIANGKVGDVSLRSDRRAFFLNLANSVSDNTFLVVAGRIAGQLRTSRLARALRVSAVCRRSMMCLESRSVSVA